MSFVNSPWSGKRRFPFFICVIYLPVHYKIFQTPITLWSWTCKIRRVHSKTHPYPQTNASAKLDVKEWSGAGKFKHRILIAQLTGKNTDDIAGYSVNVPNCRIQESGPKCELHRGKSCGCLNLLRIIQTEIVSTEQEEFRNDRKSCFDIKYQLWLWPYHIHEQWICKKAKVIFMRFWTQCWNHKRL